MVTSPHTSILYRHVLFVFFIVTMLVPAAPLASSASVSNLYVQTEPIPPMPRRFVTPTTDEPPITNPPAFRWIDARWDAYDLQISRDPEFAADDTILVSGWPLPIYMPDEPLADGVWYWRTRPYSSIGLWNDRWTETVRFEITPNLPSVPVPEMSGLVARLTDLGHPRLYMTGESLAEWKQKITSTHRLLWYALSAKVEQAALVESVDPRGLAGASVTDPDTVDDYNAAVNRASQLSEAMQLLSLSYLFTGNAAHGQKAREQLLALATWDPDGATSVRTNNTAFREIIVGLARGYDWLVSTGILSKEDQDVIVAMARRRGQAYYDWYWSSQAHSTRPYESHRSGGLAYFVELATAFAGVIPESTDWLRYTLHMMTANYPAHGRSDGSWSEGGWYWSFTIDLHLAALMGISPAIGVDMTGHPFLSNTGYYALYALPPWAELTPYGDDYHRAPAVTHSRLLQRLGSLQQNPQFAWYAEHPPFTGGFERSATGFLLFDSSPMARQPDDLPLARVFPDTGLAVLRTHLSDPKSDVYFSIKANPFGSVSHAHADQGNFTLFAFGEQLIRPSGYYPLYGDDHHATWSRQSWAHNVPLFDGRGQATRTADALGQIEHFYTSAANLVDYVRVEAGRAYRAQTPGSAARELDGYMPGLSKKTGSVPVSAYRRHAVFVRPGAIVMFDDAVTEEPMRFEWLMHTVNAAEFAADHRSLHVDNNDARLRVEFFTPDDLLLTQNTDYTFPATGRHADLPDQWHIKAQVQQKTTDHKFITVLLPYGKGSEPATVVGIGGEHYEGVELTADGEITAVVFAGAPGTMAGAGRWGRVMAEAAVLVVNESASPWLYGAHVTRLTIGAEGLSDSGSVLGSALPAGTWSFSHPVDVLLYADDDGYVLDITATDETTMTGPLRTVTLQAGQTWIRAD